MEEEKLTPKARKKIPTGILVLAVINVVIFGLFSLVDSAKLIQSPEKFKEMMTESLKNQAIDLPEVDTQHLRAVAAVSLVFPLLFIASGTGLFLGKEWARKLTLAIAIFMLSFLLITSLLVPTIIKQAIVFAAYPVILIFYLTSKKVEGYFKK